MKLITLFFLLFPSLCLAGTVQFNPPFKIITKNHFINVTSIFTVKGDSSLHYIDTGGLTGTIEISEILNQKAFISVLEEKRRKKTTPKKSYTITQQELEKTKTSKEITSSNSRNKGGSTSVNADPYYNINKYCRSVADGSYMLEKSCRDSEHEAKNKVLNRYVPKRIFKYCNEVSDDSYMLLESCIDMEIKSKNKVLNRYVPERIFKYCNEVSDDSYMLLESCIDMELEAKGSM